MNSVGVTTNGQRCGRHRPDNARTGGCGEWFEQTAVTLYTDFVMTAKKKNTRHL